jgi:glutathione S-transferase
MILVGQYDSPYVRRVAVALYHYHMPFERNALSVFSNVKPMQAINPLVRVPSLILEDGTVLIDSWCILDYLDEKAGPARALTPSHGPERRKVHQIAALAAGVIDKSMHLVYERMFHPPKSVSAEYEARCRHQIDGGLAQLEKSCGTPWYADLKMSQADITVGCMLGYLKQYLPEAFPPKSYPRLHALSMHCEMREEFVNARHHAEEDAPKSAHA